MGFNHERDIIYHATSPEESCPHDYVDESGRRVVLKKVKDHNARGISYHFLKQCIVADHTLFPVMI